MDWSRRKVQTPESDVANEKGTRDLHHPVNVSTPVYLKHQGLTGFMPDGTKIPPKKPGDDPGSRIGMHGTNPGWVDWAAAFAQMGSDLFGLSFRFAG